ncbi:hypothetical protein SAY86_013710 [Trapa natans]|uniref:Uncharacterized protein n=1 Tax=Trapa natans TaxID=22666 RepID=A0AAN7QQR0_TRANT|nr:hypothetical protein SAY86_013710 [Trapa natans]
MEPELAVPSRIRHHRYHHHQVLPRPHRGGCQELSLRAEAQEALAWRASQPAVLRGRKTIKLQPHCSYARFINGTLIIWIELLLVLKNSVNLLSSIAYGNDNSLLLCYAGCFRIVFGSILYSAYDIFQNH